MSATTSDATSEAPKYFIVADIREILLRYGLRLLLNPLSNDVGYVKDVLSTLQPALGEERHFALDGNTLIQPRLARNPYGSGPSVRPIHLFGLRQRS
jgi:hypothetical protein